MTCAIVANVTSHDGGQPAQPLLRATGLTKRFFGNAVLEDVDLELYPGQVHGLVGENGAGKSTLMKILAGVHTADAGQVEIAGERVQFSHPVQAQRAGLSTVFQEFNLLPDRTVAENIYLGREPRSRGLVDLKKMNRDTAELLDGLGVTGLSPTRRVRGLSVAEQQVVEIAKAVSYDARIISMDEPTAALADNEVDLLYRIIRRLLDRDVAILYVSHRLKEIFDLCDTITVLKDGRRVDTRPAAELDEASLVRMMVGRPLSTFFPEPHEDVLAGAILELFGAGNGFVDGIDLEVREGEIVGVAGLQGSGRTELLEAIFGVAPFTRGYLLFEGSEVRLDSPRTAIGHGVALVTEDRKAKGLSLNQSILDNALGMVRSVFPGRTRQARGLVPRLLSSMEVNARALDQEVQFLSGGNQQKVVLARWLAAESPRLLLMDEPTRGIDVGAKHAIYELMRDLAEDRVGILMVSSELPEVIGMSDRILVMRDGRIAGELPKGSSEEDVIALATGAGTEARSA